MQPLATRGRVAIFLEISVSAIKKFSIYDNHIMTESLKLSHLPPSDPQRLMLCMDEQVTKL